MQSYALQFWLFSGSILFWLLTSKPTAAQIVPDNTLPNNSIVPPNCTNCEITGGTSVGNNLFHSFEQFSVPTGGTAYFNNAATIENIISRVTGNSISNIDGVIRANGATNLFLLNPNGIIFGPNASLNIGGSFLATTADSFLFQNGFAFSASNPQAPPLLTINVPIGLQFGQILGDIRNQGALQTAPGRTLALVGGQVNLSGGILTATEGRIELGSVAANSLVNLSKSATGYTLDYQSVHNFGNILLSQGAIVNTSGDVGGAIQFQGRNITLTDASHVFSRTLGAGRGGIVTINATEYVKLNAASLIETSAEGEGQAGDVLVRASNFIELAETSEQPGGLYSQVCGDISTDCANATGNGGNLTIETRRLLIRDGARVDASTFGAGRGGDVLVIASDAVELIGAGLDGQITSGIFTQVAYGAVADAGNLTIETRRLIAQGGGQVSTATFAGGNGGTLTINAKDSIQLSGASPTATSTVGRSGLFVSAEKGAIGDAGELRITTRQLTVENGAEISANNFGTGEQGTARLNVGQLIIRNGGEVRAKSFSSGKAGNLIVNADEFIVLDNSGIVSADTKGGGGDIEVTSPSLIMRRGSSITTNAEGSNIPGGNITLNTDVLVALENSDISANSKEFQGGNVTINAQAIFGTQPRDAPTNESDITATGRTQAGTIIINTPDVDPSSGLIELPENFVDASSLVDRRCSPSNRASRFVVTGSGGLPSSPIAVLSGDAIDVNWVTLPQQRGRGAGEPRSRGAEEDNFIVGDRIVEAQGWVKGPNGEVILTANPPTATPHNSWQRPIECVNP